MFKIKQRNGNKIMRHYIYMKEPNSKSYASYLLLKDEYIKNVFLNENPIAKKIKFSRDTLTKWKNKLGTLNCIYCGGENLQIQYDDFHINPQKKATLDHIIPISDNGNIFDIDNVICSCESCNNKKGSIPLENFLSKINISLEEFNKKVTNFRNNTK